MVTCLSADREYAMVKVIIIFACLTASGRQAWRFYNHGYFICAVFFCFDSFSTIIFDYQHITAI